MDTILKFLMNNYIVFIIIFCFFGIALLGIYGEKKVPKKPKKKISEEEEMAQKIYELKNSPLAQNQTLNQKSNADDTVLKIEKESKGK